MVRLVPACRAAVRGLQEQDVPMLAPQGRTRHRHRCVIVSHYTDERGGIEMGKVHTAVLGSALLLALIVPAFAAVDNPWGTVCKLQWCSPAMPQPDAPLGDLAELAEAAKGAHCMKVEDWTKADGIPESVVIRDASTGAVSRVPYAEAWHLAETSKAWMVLACAPERKES